MFSGKNAFQKIIRDHRNQEQLIKNLNILQQSAQSGSEAGLQPSATSESLYVASLTTWVGLAVVYQGMFMQHHRAVGKHLIWCETELINWVCAGAGSWYYQSKEALSSTGHRGMTFRSIKWHTTSPELSVPCLALTVSHSSALGSVWESGIVQHDVISEMCASMVIFRWKLNCKRQTWISLCLSLSSWQEQSQKFGWRSSWPRCSVQISATRWRWRPLDKVDSYCKPQRVFYSGERSYGTTHFPFSWRRRPERGQEDGFRPRV